MKRDEDRRQFKYAEDTVPAFSLANATKKKPTAVKPSPLLAQEAPRPTPTSRMPPPPPTPTPDQRQTRLRDISEAEQGLQKRYFNLTDPDALVFCQRCGDNGHMADECPLRTCKHCGEHDKHFSRNCPTWQKCKRCRQRGHSDCKRLYKAGGGPGDPCDVCGEEGHVEEECEYLWKTKKPEKDYKPPKASWQMALLDDGRD